jgi:sugar/nucleoside kinase (ribokinase family)
MTPARIVVAGDVVDDVIAVVDHPVRSNTDTPARITRTLGGSAANTAVWLADQGCSVDFFARVGIRDVLRCSDDFFDAGVTPHLAGDEELETGSLVSIVQGDDRSMLSDRGANVALDPTEISDAVLSAATWLHLTGYSFFHHHNPEMLSTLMERARSHGLGVMVDASSAGFLLDVGPQRFIGWVKGASVLRCNEEEAQVLADSHDTYTALERLGELFPRVIVTTGERGSLLKEGENTHRIPSVPAQREVDPTGAGDAFNAGVLAGLAQGASLAESATAAASLAADAVSRLGGRP